MWALVETFGISPNEVNKMERGKRRYGLARFSEHRLKNAQPAANKFRKHLIQIL